MHAARRQEARLRRFGPVAGALVACSHRGRQFVLLAGTGWLVRSFRIGDITTGAFTLLGGGASEGHVAGLANASGRRGRVACVLRIRRTTVGLVLSGRRAFISEASRAFSQVNQSFSVGSARFARSISLVWVPV